MILVLLWTNLLVVAVPGFMMLIIRSSMVKRSLLLPLLVVIMPLMVSGNWGGASTLGESLSGLPGRTLMPVILGYLLLGFLASDGTKQKTIKGIIVGSFAFLVAANNIEFGAPALASFLAVIVSMVLIDKRRKNVLSALLGVVLGGVLYAIYSLMISGPYDFGFRIGSYAGKPYSPAEIFPIVSIHNLCYCYHSGAEKDERSEQEFGSDCAKQVVFGTCMRNLFWYLGLDVFPILFI
jgi:hypothetical protein